MPNEAIKKLMGNGYSEAAARAEFDEKIIYYMRGTLHTAEEKAYAIKCAIEDIMDDEKEINLFLHGHYPITMRRYGV